MMTSFWRMRAWLGWKVARALFRVQWLIRQPASWRWMEQQFARQAGSGDPQACEFYGHILLFRGQGLAAKEEGLRLLRIAADAGQGKAAWQLGIQAFKGDLRHEPDAAEARRRWEQALAAGHPLAATRLAELLTEGAPGVPVDLQAAARYAALDSSGADHRS